MPDVIVSMATFTRMVIDWHLLGLGLADHTLIPMIVQVVLDVATMLVFDVEGFHVLQFTFSCRLYSIGCVSFICSINSDYQW